MMIAILVLLFCSVIFFYWYITREFGYLESQGVKVIKKPTPYFGTEEFIETKPRHVLDLELYNKFGKIFGIYEGRKPALMIADPDLMKRIFVEDFHTFPHKKHFVYKNTHSSLHQCVASLRNEPWKRTHTVLAQIFSFDKLKQLVPLMSQSAEELISVLGMENKDTQNGEIEISKFAFLFSVSVVAKTVFAIDDNIFTHTGDHPFLKHARAILQPTEFELWAEKVFPHMYTYRKDAVKYFVELARRVMLDRKMRILDKNNSRFDFMQILLDAQEDEEMLLRNPLAKILHQRLPKALPDKMIIAHIVIFIFVAIQPVASAIVFALYEISKNSDIQETAATEIATFIAENEGIVDSSVLAKLRYTDNVIAEVLRMYPPLVRNERLCVKHYRLRTCVLKPGMSVIIPVYCIHHDPEFYPEPFKFDPNRFSDKSPRNRPLTYLPFGLGPRRCIGRDFALLEIKMALIYFLQNYYINLSEQSRNLECKVDKTYLKPAHGLWITLNDREKDVARPSKAPFHKYFLFRKRRHSANSDSSEEMERVTDNSNRTRSVVKITTSRDSRTELASENNTLPDVYTIENSELILADKESSSEEID